MLFGKLPFKPDPKTGEYAGAIAKLEFKIPVSKRVSPEAGQLIKRLLVPQEQRASLEEIEEHIWFNKTDFEAQNEYEKKKASGKSSSSSKSSADNV